MIQYEQNSYVRTDDDVSLFVESAGKGPPVMLCDGIGCDGFVWRHLVPELMTRFTVIHPHYRGHGRSSSPGPGGVSVARLGADMLTVLKDFGFDSALWIGHSMGSQVALEAHRARSAAFERMALLCGSSGRITHTFHGTTMLKDVLPPIRRWVDRHQTIARTIWGQVPASMAFKLASLSGEIDGFAIYEEDFRAYWDHIGRMDPEVFLEMLERAGEHSADDMLSSIKCPTLVIAAERDTFTPAKFAEQMAEQIPGAEFQLLRGASHAAPVEQPTILIQHLRRWLSETERLS